MNRLGGFSIMLILACWASAAGLPREFTVTPEDIKAPSADKQENHPEFADYLEFDHLLIYEVKDGALELLQTGARGTGFHCGLLGGTLGFDFAARELFVPNARGGTYDEAGIGFYA